MKCGKTFFMELRSEKTAALPKQDRRIGIFG